MRMAQLNERWTFRNHRSLWWSLPLHEVTINLNHWSWRPWVSQNDYFVSHKNKRVSSKPLQNLDRWCFYCCFWFFLFHQCQKMWKDKKDIRNDKADKVMTGGGGYPMPTPMTEWRVQSRLVGHLAIFTAIATIKVLLISIDRGDPKNLVIHQVSFFSNVYRCQGSKVISKPAVFCPGKSNDPMIFHGLTPHLDFCYHVPIIFVIDISQRDVASGHPRSTIYTVAPPGRMVNGWQVGNPNSSFTAEFWSDLTVFMWRSNLLQRVQPQWNLLV